MSFTKHDRHYDVVVFGATGYTGLMTATHIASSFPTNLRWAIAGRSPEKLQRVLEECKSANPDCSTPEIEIANLNDADLLALAKKTFVLITTVGPYALYGEHAVKACAEAGTHYLDCTGEAVWHLDMIKKYEATAKATGACIFPQCGIESAPSDLMTYAMASLIRSDLKTPVGHVVVDIHELNAAPSGGTLATVLNLFETYHWKEVAKSHKPYALSPVVNTTKPPKTSLWSKLTGLQTFPHLGTVTTSIAGGTNASIVMRTWGLFKQEKSLQKYAYGPKFTYREFLGTKSTLKGIFTHYALVFGGMLLMFSSIFRNMVRRFIYQPGQGPDKEEAARNSIAYRGLAIPDAEPKDSRQVISEAFFKGGMYHLTAVLLGQGALAILEDEPDLEGGFYTAACLGQGYIDRVDEHGFKMQTRIVEA